MPVEAGKCGRVADGARRGVRHRQVVADGGRNPGIGHRVDVFPDDVAACIDFEHVALGGGAD